VGTGGTLSRKILKLTADHSAASFLTGGPEDRDSAGEGTGGTFSEKLSRSPRTEPLLTQVCIDR
jgi:hypothetical protein